MRCQITILVDFQGTVRRRFDKQTIQLFILLFFSCRNFVILLMFGEAETSSAEEQLVKE